MFRVAGLVLIAVLLLGGLFVALRPEASPEGPGSRTVEMKLREAEMSPSEITFEEGTQATIEFSADQPRELHLHGYDREVEVGPGEATTLSFEAERTGRFEIEDHESGEPLGELVVEPSQGG